MSFLIKYTASKGIPMIISSGASTMEEIEDAMKAIHSVNENLEVAILHCVSNYPTEIKEINLNCMQSIKKKFGVPVGFSDHTFGISASILAVALGAELIQKHYPDFRRTINELQRYSVRGKIDSGILFSISEVSHKELIACLKEKRFNDMRKWVVQNLDKEPSSIFRSVYEVLYTALTPNSIPQAILIIAGYQYKSAFVADQEINMVACLTEIMAGCKFK